MSLIFSRGLRVLNCMSHQKNTTNLAYSYSLIVNKSIAPKHQKQNKAGFTEEHQNG